jgi:sialate O-acetylesterase
VQAGEAHVQVNDLLVGDVWLCSGQSNMEYPVAHALNGAGEVAGSADGALRLMTVPKAVAMQPQGQFDGAVSWQMADPGSVAGFSAACYFMARDLRNALKVPIGAIHSSWGLAEPCLVESAGWPGYLWGGRHGASDRFAHDRPGAVTDFAPRWQAWYDGATGKAVQPWRDPDALAWSTVPQISGWKAWTGTPLATKATGTVWLRRQVVLTAADAHAEARLRLGVLDDMDMTFVNGHAVGNSFGWDYERDYAVPAAFLHAGVNEVMVAVTNSYDDGGFKSAANKLGLIVQGRRIPLEDGWRYSISTAQTYPPRAPWDANGGIGVMYNRMIAPLGGIRLRGWRGIRGK